MSDIIYKICSRALWDDTEKAGRFEGAGIDLQDGYIHFSTAGQARETAAKHFADQDDLVIVAVATERLGNALKWEPSRGGALFPHLYEPLALDHVRWVRPLPWDAARRIHLFPDLDA